MYFEPPFWVGLYQREDGDGCRVCKVTLGREPRDQEVLAWLLANHRKLRFSPPVAGAQKAVPVPNPKRLLRQARKAVQPSGKGTKAQQALRLQRERLSKSAGRQSGSGSSHSGRRNAGRSTGALTR